MNNTQLLKFQKMIRRELDSACTKHPKFCDSMTGRSDNATAATLLFWRKVNSKAPYHADAILMEEVYEAVEAYKKGDKEAAKQELAQCGAVILRMMEFVESGI